MTSDLAASDRHQASLARRPLLWFFGLTFVLSPLLLLVPPLVGAGLGAPDGGAAVGAVLVSWAPNLAALVMVLILVGWKGVSRLVRLYGQWRIGGRFYVLAVGLPLAAALLALLVTMAWTDEKAGSLLVSLSFVGIVGALVVNLGYGPLGEEAGWRGFALPLLLERYSLFRSSLILAGIWSVWHLTPWIIAAQEDFPDDRRRQATMLVALLVGIAPGIAFLLNWLYASTRSLVPAVLVHLLFNVTGGFFDTERDLVYAVLAAVWVGFAIVLVALTRTEWTQRRTDVPVVWRDESAESISAERALWSSDHRFQASSRGAARIEGEPR